MNARAFVLRRCPACYHVWLPSASPVQLLFLKRSVLSFTECSHPASQLKPLRGVSNQVPACAACSRPRQPSWDELMRLPCQRLRVRLKGRGLPFRLSWRRGGGRWRASRWGRVTTMYDVQCKASLLVPGTPTQHPALHFAHQTSNPCCAKPGVGQGRAHAKLPIVVTAPAHSRE
jgi:hypothetical protein